MSTDPQSLAAELLALRLRVTGSDDQRTLALASAAIKELGEENRKLREQNEVLFRQEPMTVS